MDEVLFQWINQGWAQSSLQPGLDVILSWVSQKTAFTFPLLLIILLMLIKGWGTSGWRLWLLLLLSIGLGDMFGNMLKHLFEQPRPCAEFPDTVRLVMEPFKVGCSFKPHGMPSNHALNFFLAASFLFVALRSWRWGMFLGVIAFAVSLSRIYLGVHYPSQVLAGAITGSALGGFAATAALRFPLLSGWLSLSARKDHSGFYIRFVYSLILTLSVPLVLLRLLWRGRLNHEYWHRWPERFGWFGAPSLTSPIWIHAVSVGEVQAALPLIRELQSRYPQRSIVVTTTTPTGSSRVKAEFSDSVFHIYAPYDLPGAVERFLDRIKPTFALVMETELWPNLFYQSRQRDIPVVVANARLSSRSMTGYLKFKSLSMVTLQQIEMIAAQNRTDAEHFAALGMPANRIQVTGSIKFDLQIPDDIRKQGLKLRTRFGNERPVWIAASTHEGEEEQILAAFTRIRQELPDCLLVLVPRHPERSVSVVTLCEKAGYSVFRRSEDKAISEVPNKATQVYVGDTLGELLLLYAASDVAFVGGSLVPKGGQNILEPAALGKPVITGPHVFNFNEIAKAMVEAGALRQVDNSEQLSSVVVELLTHPRHRKRMGEQGLAQVEKNRGSLQRLLAIIAPYIH